MIPIPRCSGSRTASGSTSASKTDVRKDLAARLADADAEFLVVDNSPALLFHRKVNGRLYTLLSGEATDLMDTLWNADPTQGRALAVKLSHEGLTDEPEIDLRLASSVPAWTASIPRGSSWSGPTLRGSGSRRTARSRRPTSTGATHGSSRRWTITSSSRPAAGWPLAPWVTSHLRSAGRPSTTGCGGRSRRTWSSSARSRGADQAPDPPDAVAVRRLPRRSERGRPCRRGVSPEPPSRLELAAEVLHGRRGVLRRLACAGLPRAG